MLVGPNGAEPTPAPKVVESRESQINRLVARGEYDKAIELFEALFEEDANPVWIFNIAVVYDTWGRCGPALEAFERHAALCAQVACPHAEIAEARRERVRAKCNPAPPAPDAGVEPPDATPLPSRLLWEVPEAAEVRVDGVQVEPDGSGAYAVEPGARVLNLALPSHGEMVLDVQLNPGETLKVDYFPPDRAWRSWTAAALLGLGAVVSVGAVRTFHESNEAKERALDDPHDLSHVRTYQSQYGWGMGLSFTAGLVSAIGLGLGTWAFLDPDETDRRPPEPAADTTSSHP